MTEEKKWGRKKKEEKTNPINQFKNLIPEERLIGFSVYEVNIL